jgi:hypothetical protein
LYVLEAVGHRYNPSKNGAEMWPVHAGASSSLSKLLVIDGSIVYDVNERLFDYREIK